MANKAYYISGQKLSLKTIENIVTESSRLELSEEAKGKIINCRKYLDEKIKNLREPVYGINTGFGALYNKSIKATQIEQLQENLVKSHACGTGEEVPKEIVKLMLLLKIHALSLGYSGVELSTVQRLVDLYNNNIIPVVYQQGSLGASGDLAPLAHLSLPLIGKGEVYYEGKKQAAETILKKLKWKPLQFKAKEALALLNGTQFMSAYGIWCLQQAFHLADCADIIGAISLDAFDGRPEPFNALLHNIRPHAGQIKVADNFRKLLKGSVLIKQKKEHVQDPYSFRCIPQVHGATRDIINFVSETLLIEINSVTDNPTLFSDENIILSGGNFHGQPLAFAADFLAIALSELGNISERRNYQLISGQRNLPMFLVKNPGLNSGFMITQYTAASIVSQNKQLCTPASVDSIVSSNGQEDHVSMGANAATKCYKVIENVEKILALELFAAAQAIEFRRPLKSSPLLEKRISDYRKSVKFIENDIIMHPEIKKSVEFLKSLKF